MPRIIIMDKELHEALTVIEVPAWFMREVENGQRGPTPYFRAFVPQEMRVTQRIEDCMPPSDKDLTTILLQRVVEGPHGQHLFWYGYALEPDRALELHAAFLPGQLAEVRRREKAAYITGLLEGAFG